MKRRLFPSSALIAAVVVLIAGGQLNALHAQTLFGVPVGGTASRLSQFGPVSGEDKYRGMDVYRWIFPNKNQFTATVDAEGEIVYLESDWFGASDDTGCDLKGLKFGVTTLADLRKRFGSDGFTFRGRRGSIQAPDGVALLYSWEVDKEIVTFYAKISTEDNARVRAEGSKETVADYAKLYAISMASAGYARNEWGARIAEPSPPKKMVWK
jgi:hypothetical protein